MDPQPTARSNMLPHGIYRSRGQFPFGLTNAATTCADNIHDGVGAREEGSGPLLRATMNLGFTWTASIGPGFDRAPGPRRRVTIGNMRRWIEEEATGRPWTPSNSDPDSDDSSSGCYDFARECFHLEGDVSASTNAGNPAATPTNRLVEATAAGIGTIEPRPAEPPRNLTEERPDDDARAAQLAQLHEIEARLEADRANLEALKPAVEQN